MVKLIGAHRLNEAKLVSHLAQVRHHVGDSRAGLAVRTEGEPWTEHAGVGLDERVALVANHRGRQRFSLQLL